MYRVLKKTTLQPEQVKTIKELYEQNKRVPEIAKIINVSKHKVYHNMQFLGLTKEKPVKTSVIEMNGYFDLESFAKHYSY